MSNGGPGFQIIDETPEGQLFLTRDPFLFVAPDVAGSVMVFNATSGIVFVGNVGARQAFVGNGTISGTGIAYAPPIVNGGRVSLLFANGRTAAPASMTGEFTREKAIRNGSIVIQGHEDNPIQIVGADYDGPLFFGGGPVLVGATTPAQWVGNYTEADIQNAPARPLGTLTMDANSLITGTDVFGRFTGRVIFGDTTPLLQKIELTYTPTGGAARTMAGYFLTKPASSPGSPIQAIGTIAVGDDSLFDYGWLRP